MPSLCLSRNHVVRDSGFPSYFRHSLFSYVTNITDLLKCIEDDGMLSTWQSPYLLWTHRRKSVQIWRRGMLSGSPYRTSYSPPKTVMEREDYTWSCLPRIWSRRADTGHSLQERNNHESSVDTLTQRLKRITSDHERKRGSFGHKTTQREKRNQMKSRVCFCSAESLVLLPQSQSNHAMQ